jgi:hypothetical protein
MEQELLNKIKNLEEENNKLKNDLNEAKEHLKKYTSPERTILKKSSNIFEKQTAAKELGYKYEIWVYDNNGNKLEVYD